MACVPAIPQIGIAGASPVIRGEGGKTMRRTMLGTVAIWVAGGAVLAGDEPRVNPLGVVPGTPQANVLVPMSDKAPAGPLVQPLQSLVTPVGVTIQTVAAPPANMPIALPAPTEIEPAVVPMPAAEATLADSERWFGSVDYVLFWMRHNPTPPLVQVLPANLANFNVGSGSLPPGAATSVFGEHGTNPESFSGIRIAGGVYFDNAKCWGVDGSYLQLFQKGESFSIASPGIPVIGRPFFDAAGSTDAFLRYTTPDGLSSGFIRVDAPVKMYTFDGNLRAEGPSLLSDRVDYLLGLRYLNLKDSLTIDSGVTNADPRGGPSFTINSHEGFRARNEFYGSQVGFETHYRWGCYSLEVTGKFAAGWVHQEVRIDGFSTTQLGAATPTLFPNQSILLVQPSNAGTHSRNRFAVLPEGMVNFGYQITPHVRATFGYDALVLSSVERSGDAINRNVNPALTKFIQTQQPSTVQQPNFGFHADGWWAQGLMAGLAVTY